MHVVTWTLMPTGLPIRASRPSRAGGGLLAEVAGAFRLRARAAPRWSGRLHVLPVYAGLPTASAPEWRPRRPANATTDDSGPAAGSILCARGTGERPPMDGTEERPGGRDGRVLTWR